MGYQLYLLSRAIYTVAILALSVPTSGQTKLTATEQELVALADDYNDDLETFWEASSKYETRETRKEALLNGEITDPSVAYLPRLLAFEESHRG